MSKFILVKYLLPNGKTYLKKFEVPLDWKKVKGISLHETIKPKRLNKVGDISE